MAKFEWMKYYLDQVAADLAGATLAEEGAYHRAARHCFALGPLPEERLRLMCREAWDFVKVFMVTEGYGLIMPWVSESRNAVGKHYDQRSEAGKESAKKRTTVQRPFNDRSTGVLSLSHSPSLSLEEKERARESKQRAEESFARFWAVYARKEGKQAAAKAWTRLNDEDRAEAEKRAKSFCAARDPAYLPHPATYQNGRRWEDADPPKPAPKAVNGQPTLMSRAEAMEALRKIRAQHGIPVGGFIEAHLIPDEVNKALR